MEDVSLDELNELLRAEPDYRAGMRFVQVPSTDPATYFYEGASDAFVVCMRVAAKMGVELRRGAASES